MSCSHLPKVSNTVLSICDEVGIGFRFQPPITTHRGVESLVLPHHKAE
jgi:hypothetical protein